MEPHCFFVRCVIAMFAGCVVVYGEVAVAVEEMEDSAEMRSAVHELLAGRPSDVMMDSRLLEQAATLVQDSVSEGEIPGAVVFVARRGKVVLHRAFGWKDVSHSLPMERDTLFRMASNSKAVTAAGILLLVEDGDVSLDQNVGEYLPAFDRDGWADVTVRHLLTHTSGLEIKSLFIKPLLKQSHDQPGDRNLVTEVNRFASSPPTSVGEKYAYNNAGYNMLAAMIQHMTGSYREHLRSRIYRPLKMKDSCNHESEADRQRMATVLQRQASGTWREGWTPQSSPDYPFPRGSGGMVSTASDYAKFCQMLLNGGTYQNKRILRKSSVDQATKSQRAEIAAAKSYGLGWKTNETDGTFSHSGSDGTYVWVDPGRQLIGMLLTQCKGSTIPRESFRELVNRSCIDTLKDHSLSGQADQADTVVTGHLFPGDLPMHREEGFYKDLFMSSGAHLTSRTKLHAAESLGLSYEYYAGSDAQRQNDFLIGSNRDENGVLLYPDGQPRYRMLYVNGGGATKHGLSLDVSGRQRIRQFNKSGGSYCGSCAGSFLSGRNVDARTDARLGYLHLFPHNTFNTGLKKVHLQHRIPDASPLHAYRSFGEDQLVNAVYHNNGNWLPFARASKLDGTEVLARYDNPGHKIDGGAAIWSYRAEPTFGRVVNIGSHPETSDSGEKLVLTEACLLHALTGVGEPRVKGHLKSGAWRKMTKKTSDQQPEYTRIGDLQYHHFSFSVPEQNRGESSATLLRNLRVELQSDWDVDLHLFVSKDRLAFQGEADHVDERSGAVKTLDLKLLPGKYYVSVKCSSVVGAIEDEKAGFYRYYGDVSILNGVPYCVRVMIP